MSDVKVYRWVMFANTNLTRASSGSLRVCTYAYMHIYIYIYVLMNVCTTHSEVMMLPAVNLKPFSQTHVRSRSLFHSTDMHILFLLLCSVRFWRSTEKEKSEASRERPPNPNTHTEKQSNWKRRRRRKKMREWIKNEREKKRKSSLSSSSSFFFYSVSLTYIRISAIVMLVK